MISTLNKDKHLYSLVASTLSLLFYDHFNNSFLIITKKHHLSFSRQMIVLFRIIYLIFEPKLQTLFLKNLSLHLLRAHLTNEEFLLSFYLVGHLLSNHLDPQKSK